MQKGLIISNVSNLYNVEDLENNKIYKCTPKGKFKQDKITPIVGDFVKFEIIDENVNQGVISEILERKNYIKRPKIANITQITFIISMKMPKPDLLLLDKQLAFAEFMKIKPIIVLNKIDLVNKQEIEKIEQIYKKIGYKIVKTQGKIGHGIQELKRLLKNNITVFSGNSGVGKSTIINQIFEDKLTIEGIVSNKNKKGKNTTTSISLYKINKDTYIADTPGFSSFNVFEIESKDLDKYFIEFNKFIGECEFIDCSHIKEENCGIKQGIKQGKINEIRYTRYCQIYNELKKEEENKW